VNGRQGNGGGSKGAPLIFAGSLMGIGVIMSLRRNKSASNKI
jgi:hypothetical protein